MLSRFRLRCHFSQVERRLPGIFSSQSVPCLHNSWRIRFPFRTRGDKRPRGSKMELTVDSKPRLVAGRSIISFLNCKVSDSTHHCTPKALSTGSFSQVKLRSLMPLALSSGGNDSNTALLLDTSLCKWNPPRSHRPFVFPNRFPLR